MVEASLPAPSDDRLAARWASFVLPGTPVLVMEAEAGTWMAEDRPALFELLRRLGFEPAREGLDSELFPTGVGEPPRAPGLLLRHSGDDLRLELSRGADDAPVHTLETFPGAASGHWMDRVADRGGALVIVGGALGLPGEGGIGFDELLPALLERGLGAWVELARPPAA